MSSGVKLEVHVRPCGVFDLDLPFLYKTFLMELGEATNENYAFVAPVAHLLLMAAEVLPKKTILQVCVSLLVMRKEMNCLILTGTECPKTQYLETVHYCTDQ